MDSRGAAHIMMLMFKNPAKAQQKANGHFKKCDLVIISSFKRKEKKERKKRTLKLLLCYLETSLFNEIIFFFRGQVGNLQIHYTSV